MSNTAILEIDGKKYEFPVIMGTENEIAIDIDKLRSASGAITIDPGYKTQVHVRVKLLFRWRRRNFTLQRLFYRGFSDKADF